MLPTEKLSVEHRHILRAVGALERFVDQSEKEGKLEAGVGARFVEFIREYSDRWHHAKEENLLFPAMNRAGFPLDGGPIAVMLRDHDTGRDFTRAMAKNPTKTKTTDNTTLRTFANGAQSYIELLRGHIAKEDHILYPMADDALTGENQEALDREFDAAEAGLGREMGPRFEQEAAALGEKFGFAEVTEADQQAMTPSCHGGC